MKNTILLAIHGGAGDIISKHAVDEHLATLQEILISGNNDLRLGKTALDVVSNAVLALENSDYFNAGRGSVLTAEGTVEMDASIMDGSSRAAGAVANVTTIKNPTLAARAVMEKSNHVFMVGEGAETFARKSNLELIDNSYFITSYRFEELSKIREQSPQGDVKTSSLGTVGAVALDLMGNLAAATSTGGRVNKLPGRVGDSPIIGAGTWADNETCAVSATGDGEIFTRCAFAHEIDALIRYRQLDLISAGNNALQTVQHYGGRGGCIIINRQGEVALLFNSESMYRGWIGDKGIPDVAVYR